jgi:hypothetical protein
MTGGMLVMTASGVGVVGGLLVSTGLVMFRCFMVVMRSLFMMASRVSMMGSSFLGHRVCS